MHYLLVKTKRIFHKLLQLPIRQFIKNAKQLKLKFVDKLRKLNSMCNTASTFWSKNHISLKHQ